MRKEAVKEVLAQELNIPPEKIAETLEKMEQSIAGKRNGKQSPPEGGISLRAASRKYGVPHPTLSVWVKRGYIPILLRTKNELYIDELKLAKLIDLYKENPGQGKHTIKQLINL